ncbi:hypothetical protein ABK040_000134 [Willaertia magna]
MRQILWIGYFFLIVFFVNGIISKSPEEGMKGVLDVDNVDLIENRIKGTFVEFYAPWCGHCQVFAAEMAKLGEIYHNHKDIQLAKVNCVVQTSICNKYSINSYPSLKWFPPEKDGKVEDFNQRRTIDNIVNFLNQKTGSNDKPTSIVETTTIERNEKTSRSLFGLYSIIIIICVLFLVVTFVMKRRK